MKIEFKQYLDPGVHEFEFNFTSENNYQIKIDGEVVIQKLGEFGEI